MSRAAVLAFVALTWGSAASAAAPAAVATVSIENMAFGPAPASLHVGDSIEWVNKDIFRHTATARDGSFDLDLPPKGHARVILRKPGVLQVRCRYHPGMTTTLKILQASTAKTSQSRRRRSGP